MDDTQLNSLIKESQLLTASEKTYWSSNLPKMTPEQKDRLVAILNRAKKIKWNDQIQQYLSMIGKATQSYFTKKQSA